MEFAGLNLHQTRRVGKNVEADCWKCHPEKAPVSFKKRSGKGGVTASNVEITLVSLYQQDFA